MDWEQVAPDFEPDGALRNIYVFGTDLSDWQSVWEALRTWEPLPIIRVGGQLAISPDKVQDIFAETGDRAVMSVDVCGAIVNCHFFVHDEIEFDLDPGEVTGPIQLDGFDRFMTLLGRATGKAVVMTMENSPESVILRYEPGAQRLEWVGPVETG